jgi:hypothetical protein
MFNCKSFTDVKKEYEVYIYLEDIITFKGTMKLKMREYCTPLKEIAISIIIKCAF